MIEVDYSILNGVLQASGLVEVLAVMLDRDEVPPQENLSAWRKQVSSWNHILLMQSIVTYCVVELGIHGSCVLVIFH